MITNYKYINQTVRYSNFDNFAKFINTESPKVYKHGDYLNLATMRKTKNIPKETIILFLPEVFTGDVSGEDYKITFMSNGIAYNHHCFFMHRFKYLYSSQRKIVQLKQNNVEVLKMPNVKRIFILDLVRCEALKFIDLPKLKIIESVLIRECKNLEYIILENVQLIREIRAYWNFNLEVMRFEKLKNVFGTFDIRHDMNLVEIDLPKLEVAHEGIEISSCPSLRKINIPKLSKPTETLKLDKTTKPVKINSLANK